MGLLDDGLSWLNGDAGRFRAAVLVLAAAVLALAGAYYFQYVLKLPPCQLCLIQRWPFYAAIPASAAAAWTHQRAPTASRLLLALVGLGFLAGAGVAVYHAGVEWQFWPGPESCSGSFTVASDADEFLQRLQKVQIVSCSEAAWRFAGLSLAGWNVPISLGLALIALLGVCAGRSRRD
ncbi:disulfide bond formation protein B [Pseudochelatococcus sp. B33]